jgi:hypothetical protein
LFSCLSENGPPEEHPQLTQQALKSPELLELRIKATPDLGAQLIHPPHLARENIVIYRKQSRLLYRSKFPMPMDCTAFSAAFLVRFLVYLAKKNLVAIRTKIEPLVDLTFLMVFELQFN